MMALDKLDDRYRNDAHFKAMVDALMVQILDLNLTPSEIREIACYAALRVEVRYPKPLQAELDPDSSGCDVQIRSHDDDRPRP